MTSAFSYGAIGWQRPLVEVVRNVAQLGFAGIEAFGLTDPLPRDERLHDALLQAGIRLSAVYYSGSFVEPDRAAQEASDFNLSLSELVRLGGKQVVLGGGRVRAGHRDGDWRTFLRTVERLANMAWKRGVEMAYHPHSGTLVFTPDEIARFAGATDPGKVKLALDTGHLGMAASDIVCLFEQYFQRIAVVHLKDLRDGAFVELGRGNLPIPEVYRVLQSNSFTGWITVELDASPDPVRSALLNRDYLRKVLKVGALDPARTAPT